MNVTPKSSPSKLVPAILLMSSLSWSASTKLTIESLIGTPYPSELVSARKADRIAWIAYAKGARNVYTAAAPGFEPVRLTANTADDGKDLTDLRISDDGTTLAFVRGHAPNREGWIANPTSDPKGGERAIWAIRSAGGRPWKLAVGGAPQLSPDARWVVYVRDGQIHGVRVAATPAAAPAEPQPLFRAFGSNSNPVWSPDGKHIAFTSDRGDHGYVGIYDIDKPNVRYLAPGVDHDSSPAWSPDSRRVAFIRKPGTPFGAQVLAARGDSTGAPLGRVPVPGRRGGSGRRGNTDELLSPADGLSRAVFQGGYSLSLRVADATTGEARELWHNAPGDLEFATMTRIQWAADRLVFLAERNNWEHYYSLPVEGNPSQPVDLTPGAGFVEQAAVSPDGRFLYGATNIGNIDRRHIWKCPVAGGEPVGLTSGDSIETYPVALASGRVAVLGAGARQPLSVADGKTRVIFPRLGPGFPAAEHVAPENVTVRADDGLECHNQLFLPRGIPSGDRRPALVFIHGGPSRQMLLGYHYMHFYHMAYAINQYFAGQGYVVLSVNYRSGIGYGREFRRAPRTGARGNAEYQDVLAAGKYLRGRPDVDPQRIGVWGLSYGGVLTAQALARNSDVFAAGVDMAGIHLWGNSVDRESVPYQASSISAIDKWKSPVLLIHGDDDRNVPFSQTTGLVQLLRARNIYHELIVFPDDVHDSLLYSRWLTAFHATENFFKRFLQKE
jgi:dipeptidyl-peptidase-4